MTKDVLVSVKGNHNNGHDEDEVEMINQGQFYRRNGRIYIKYEEIVPGYDKPTSSMIKVSEKSIEITKKGMINTHMMFILGEKISTFYESPFGAVNMGIKTDVLKVSETDNLYRIDLGYDMEMNGQFVNRCNITIKVMPKGDERFTLMDG